MEYRQIAFTMRYTEAHGHIVQARCLYQICSTRTGKGQKRPVTRNRSHTHARDLSLFQGQAINSRWNLFQIGTGGTTTQMGLHGRETVYSLLQVAKGTPSHVPFFFWEPCNNHRHWCFSSFWDLAIVFWLLLCRHTACTPITSSTVTGGVQY